MTLDQGILAAMCLGALALIAVLGRIVMRLRRGDYDFTPTPKPAGQPGTSTDDSALGTMKSPDIGPD